MAKHVLLLTPTPALCQQPRAICAGGLLVKGGSVGYKVLCHQLAILILLCYACGREIVVTAALDSDIFPATIPLLGFATSLFQDLHISMYFPFHSSITQSDFFLGKKKYRFHLITLVVNPLLTLGFNYLEKNYQRPLFSSSF